MNNQYERMNVMEMLEVMKARHSVRQYTDKKILADIRKKLLEKVDTLNKESGLHMQLFFDEPECFDSARAHYGKFSGGYGHGRAVSRPQWNGCFGCCGTSMEYYLQLVFINGHWWQCHIQYHER